MPIFEYRCQECGNQFEHFQRSGGPEAACPSCGSATLERKISLCGFTSAESSAANLSAAHKRAAQKRAEKSRSEHHQHHEHFEDAPPPKPTE